MHSVRTNIYEGRSSTPSGSFVIAGHQQPTSVMHVCLAERNNMRSTSPLLTRPYKVQIFYWIAAAYYCTAVKKNSTKSRTSSFFIARSYYSSHFANRKSISRRILACNYEFSPTDHLSYPHRSPMVTFSRLLSEQPLYMLQLSTKTAPYNTKCRLKTDFSL